MKRGDKISLVEGEILEINHLIKILGKHLKKFEEAYIRRDSKEFNLLKGEILQIQRKIHSIIE